MLQGIPIERTINYSSNSIGIGEGIKINVHEGSRARFAAKQIFYKMDVSEICFLF